MGSGWKFSKLNVSYENAKDVDEIVKVGLITAEDVAQRREKKAIKAE